MQITDGLALVHFRRERVYLSGDCLAQQHEFHRYATGARKLQGLCALRAAVIGRAIHSDLETWTAHVNGVAENAKGKPVR